MARFDYSSYLKKEETKKTVGDYKVSYFGLKDDGDEATVRFVYNSTEEFHLATIHSVDVEGKQRRVSCLRTGTEPLSKCPLCDSGNRVYDKMYVKLIQYTTESNGQVSHQARVWERPAYFSKTLESLFKEYGTLSDIIFKIKRHGKKGDTKTTYDILYANPAIYKPELYVKDFSDFDNFEINKFFYTEKTAGEMKVFLQTGHFPEKTAGDTIAPPVPTTHVSTAEVFKTQTETPVKQTTSVPAYDHAQPQTAAPVETSASDDPTSQRPRRYTY